MQGIRNYFISGIATDERAFHLQYDSIPNAVYLPFPKHGKKDKMSDYARRFIPLINTAEPFNLIGHSMGGIITMEIIKHIRPEKVILISSVKSRKEMPFNLKQLKITHFHKLLPGKGFIKSIEVGSKFIKEIMQTPGLRELAVSMAKNNDPSFLYWAVNAIVKWNGDENYRQDIIHLHGTKDTMFPYKNIKNPIPVFGGTHEMNIIKAEEVNRLILYYLNK